MAHEQKLLNLRDVVAMTTLSRATVYRFIRGGVFPRAVRIGPRRVAWLESDVIGWMTARQPN